AYECEGDIWTVSATGGKPKQVHIVAASDDKHNNIERLNLTSGATEIDVTADGKTLAIALRGELWSLPADRRGDDERLTNNPANDHQLSWSPDGKTLAFASDRNGPFNIYTLDTSSGALKQISKNNDDESLPSFSPDNKLIAFLRSGTNGGLYVSTV